jgi:hypothetical protein
VSRYTDWAIPAHCPLNVVFIFLTRNDGHSH